MKFLRFSPLFAAADPETPGGGGSAPVNPPESAPAEETEPEDEQEEQEEDAPAAPAEPKPLSAFQRGRLRALGMGGLIARVEKAEGELAGAHAELATAHARIATLEASAALVPAQIAAAAAGRENEVSRGVRQELQAIGITEAAAPAQVGADANPSALLEKLQTLKGAEKIAFFREHSAALKAAEAAAKN